MTAPAVLIVGAGAVGALFGSALARQGALVSVVCRSDFTAISRHGYRIRSAQLGDHVFRPHRVLQHVAEYGMAPDYLLLTAKVLDETDRVALIRPAVGHQTVLVLIQNGVEIEAPIAGAWPHHELLSGLAFVAVNRVGAGEIHHLSPGSLILGNYPTGISPGAQRLATLFEASKVPCRLTSEVVRARWQRAVWNATFNPISVLGGGLTTAMMLRSREDQSFLRRAMQEVCAVAAAVGHAQPTGLIERLLADTRALPPFKTSMAVDFENQRSLELEAILGNVVRAGRAARVPMPTLECLYALTGMIVRARGAG